MPPATAGSQQWAGKPQPQIAIHRPVSRLFFFLSPYLWWENNWTTHACWKTYWNCIAFELRTLGGLFLCVCAVLFHFMSPLWWDNYRTTSEAPSPGLQAEGWTPKLLRLKFHCIWTWRLLFFIFHFLFCFILFFIHFFLSFTYFLIFILIFTLFIFYFQSSFCLSNAFSAYGWLVHCFSLFIALKLFCLFLCFFFYLIICFSPFPLTSLLSIPSHPSILNITSAIIAS
jgi:hypothetical protein